MTLVEQSREYLDKSTNFFYGLLKSTGLFSDKWIDDTIAYEKDLNREMPIKLQETFNRFMDDVQTFTNTNPFLVRNPWIITAAQAVLAITLLPFAVALAAGTTAFVGTFIPNYFVNALSSAAEQAKQLWRLIFKRWVTYEHLDHGRAELVQKVRWVRSPLDFATNFVKIMIKLATTPVRVIPSTVQESARNALDAARTVLNWPLFVILHRPLRKLFGFDQWIYDAAVVKSQGYAIHHLQVNVHEQRKGLTELSGTVLGTTYEYIPRRPDGRGITQTVSELQTAVFGNKIGRLASEGIIHDVKALQEQQAALNENIARVDGLRKQNGEDLAEHAATLGRHSQMLHQHGISIKRHERILATLVGEAVEPTTSVPSDLGPGVEVLAPGYVGTTGFGPGVDVSSTRTPSPTPQG